MNRVLGLSLLVGVALLLSPLSSSAVAAPAVDSAVYQETTSPGSLILDKTIVFDDSWIATHPKRYDHNELTIPGPGVLNTATDGHRTDDPLGRCGSKGGVRFYIYDVNGEQMAGFWTGDTSLSNLWTNGGILYADADACISSNGDVYPYESFIKVYFDPDPDMDKVPDSRDMCPGTPAGASVDEQGYTQGKVLASISTSDEVECVIACAQKYDLTWGDWGTLNDRDADWLYCGNFSYLGEGIPSGGDVYNYNITANPFACLDFNACVEACEANQPSLPPETSEPIVPTAEIPAAGTPQLILSVSPNSFHQLGDTVQLTVTLLEAGGAPMAGQLVQLALTEPQGGQVQDYTDANGVAYFTLSHVDEHTHKYTYHVTAAGLEQWFELPVAIADIKLETNPVTGAPFQGVAADGVSTLTIALNLPNLASGTVAFNPPQLGSLKGNAIPEFYNQVQLDGGGQAEITYQPPTYLTDKNALTNQQVLHQNDSAFPAWSATDSIVFTYTNADGAQETYTLEIQVFRPPVMLVHGFTGNINTWAQFADYLSSEKFDPVLKDYSGNQNSHIQDLSNLLKENIQEQKRDYAQKNIKLTKVDIVAHSMGGLISRNYVEPTNSVGTEPYGQDVRKLIMVGTPNHGVNAWYDKLAGAYGSWTNNYKHWEMLFQLYSTSYFLRSLNYGEANGQHLNQAVEYANIIGRRPSKLNLPGLPYDDDDGVVTTSSAQLNGVVSYIYDGVRHSPDLPYFDGVGITVSQQVWSKVHALLLEEIFRPPLQGSRIQIHRGEGEVFFKAVNGDWQVVPSYPTEIWPWYYVQTGQGRATIALYLNDILWGTVQMRQNTELVFDYTSPELVRVLLKSGSARFRSVQREGLGHFDVYLGQEGNQWYEFQPHARIRGIGTDFVVDVDQVIHTYVLEGQVGVEGITHEGGSSVQALVPQQGNAISENGIIESAGAPTELWWEDEFYDTSDLENEGSLGSGLWAIFYASACGWIIVAGGLLGVVLLSRKRKFARWLIPVSIGAAALCTLSTCVLGIMAFTGAPSQASLPESSPTTEPTTVLLTQTMPQQQSQVELTLINGLNEQACTVNISPSGSDDWGEDWLGDENTLQPGNRLTFSIPTGTYDLRVLDCAGNTLVEMYKGDVYSDTEWTLTE